MKNESKKEYGGCLYFEVGINNTEYYHAWNDLKIDVDSGRSALQFILENYNFKRIWLPVYNCPLVGKRIEKNQAIEICWYNIDNNFRPVIDTARLFRGDCLLWVNYYGVMSQTLIDEIVALQEISPVKIIIDNIPAYFSRPRMSALNIYSCRKFIGVPDGGHIIGNDVKPIQLPTYPTACNYFYLLKAMESGSNSAYEDYQKSERRFSESNIAYGMPILTKKMLKNINYEWIINKRKNNFNVLHALLNETNRLKYDKLTMTPSVYPYLSLNKQTREKLLDNKIYISRFWKHVLTNELANEFEKELAEYLIPLPIDQRYNEQDMQYIANMVKKLEED